VVPVGDCAADGGLYAGIGEVPRVVPVDLNIRGCPAAPTAIPRRLPALLEAAGG
jgi:Ni,Fe-hydrogenase III small subunit